MRNILLVGAGGFLGAIVRYAITVLLFDVSPREFPLATFLINITGAFALGFFMTFVAERAHLEPGVRLFVATGFLGAYTTFSTFEFETFELVKTGLYAWSAANVIGSVVAGYAAVQLGVALAR